MRFRKLLEVHDRTLKSKTTTSSYKSLVIYKKLWNRNTFHKVYTCREAPCVCVCVFVCVCMYVHVPVGDRRTGAEPSSALSDPRITPDEDTNTHTHTHTGLLLLSGWSGLSADISASQKKKTFSPEMSAENEFSVQLRVVQQKHSAAARFQCFFHWCCHDLSWERSLTTGSQNTKHTHTHSHTSSR